MRNEKWEIRKEKRGQSYKLTKKKDFFIDLSNQYIKINYSWFNRQEIVKKSKDDYSKEKAAELYKQNKAAIKEESRERYKNMSQEEKDKIKKYQKNIKNWFSIKKKR